MIILLLLAVVDLSVVLCLMRFGRKPTPKPEPFPSAAELEEMIKSYKRYEKE
jgi:hypothetical protein